MRAASHLDHLTDADLALMAQVVTRDAPVEPAELRRRPDQVVALLGEPRLFGALFSAAPGAEPFLRVSPFLAFACLVERAADDLESAVSVAEPVGARRRVPVFDAHELREFVAPPPRRLFLAELLTSYTHVASGAVWVRQRRRWRQRRFSELDLTQLARLLDVVPARERPGVYRRLGDLALFLTGIFPDYCSRPLTSPTATERLLRAAGAAPGAAEPASGVVGALALLERLGGRCYREACATAAAPTAALVVLNDMADGFSRARRVLNFLTDRYLFATREEWFSPPG
jgi:hypothetical protein